MDKKTAQDILESVKSAYSAIAQEFSASRPYLWGGFEEFLQYVKENDLVLDVGCGNGRLIQLFLKLPVQYTGLDSCEHLLKLASEAYPDKTFVRGDVLKLPFDTGYFDVLFCIATIHHVPSDDLRNQTMREIYRVLKSGGYLIMTNWDLFTKRYWKYIFRSMAQKFFKRSKLDWKDIMVPWKNKTMRYYHCFTLSEMRSLAQSSGFDIIKHYKARHGKNKNLVMVVKKV